MIDHHYLAALSEQRYLRLRGEILRVVDEMKAHPEIDTEDWQYALIRALLDMEEA